MRPGHELAMMLRRAYLAVHRRAGGDLSAAGATADQFVVLTVLAEADGITQMELAAAAGSDANTVAAMVGLLERRGLVRRERDRDDRRARRVSLTPTGRRLQTRLWSAGRDLHERLAAAVPAARRKALLEDLATLTQAAGAPNGRRRNNGK